jgi:hypothetical protein
MGERLDEVKDLRRVGRTRESPVEPPARENPVEPA